ncbi:MAG: DUF3370 family protein [Cyanobacteriota bacterium]|nr:DUF3370 family protein [Cyanobacteriota bacterium]
MLAAFAPSPSRLFPGLALGGLLLLAPNARAQSYVALMEGQRAIPLRGRFNTVPVLHSNQPEEVEGPGLLISTAPGTAIAAETGETVEMPAYTFKGDFGLHLHHKYFPPYRASISPSRRRTELTLATILINPGVQPVRVTFSAGAVRNSFEAPYLARHLLGVRPLGPRPWNTGPGDATAVQLLRGRLDPRLSETITVPPRGRVVLFRTALPALGIANALLRGRSDGPLQIAVVAAKDPESDEDLFAVLDRRLLAPGRVYLRRISEIQAGTIFSRVGGVALGDHYQASLQHDLNRQGPLHVPLTSTRRTHFGTGEVQVNALASRVIDSSVDNVGTYGVRFDVDLNLLGQGAHDLVLSHPAPIGGRPFTAFRGSMEIRTPEGVQSVHVGLRSGQSLSLTQLNLQPGQPTPIRLSLVYPADSTPGHLLSVVPSTQLAQLQEQERRQEMARLNRSAPPGPPPPPAAGGETPETRQPLPTTGGRPTAPPRLVAPPLPPALREPPRPRVPGPLTPPPEILRAPSGPTWLQPPPTLQAPPPASQGGDPLADRYREALEAQELLLRQWQRNP